MIQKWDNGVAGEEEQLLNETKRYYIMTNQINREMNIVVDMLKEQESNEKFTKKAFAEKHSISARTLSRYVAKHQEEALQVIEDEKKVDQPKEEEAPKSEEPKKETKKQIAIRIYKEMEGSKRKEIMERFQNEAGLTKAGANTYLHNIKKEFEK